MKSSEIFRHPVESFRAAPLGLGNVAIGIAEITVAFPILSESPTPSGVVTGVVLAAAGLLHLNGGADLSERSLLTYEQAKVIAENDTFEPWALKHTTKTWCGRQAVQAAFRGSKHEESYRDLCESTKESSQFTWVPHF